MIILLWSNIIVEGLYPTQSYGEKYKKPHPRFHRFCYKNLFNWFVEIISHNYLFFSHIIVWFYIFNFKLKQRQKSVKFLENFNF